MLPHECRSGREYWSRSPRVYSLWVNGNETFYFNADREQVTELISSFSTVRLRDHVVRLRSGEPVVKSFKGNGFSYNVSLNVLGGSALAHARTQGAKAETYDPVLTVYVSGAELRDELEQFEWPEHIVIRNDIPDWELKSKTRQPFRKMMHVAVNFDDGKPAADFEHGMTTTITLWEKGYEHGFDLGHVSYKGLFNAAFSLREIARLKNGEMWLTMTVGNNLTKASPEHPRLKIDSFSLNPENAQPVRVARSKFYHGRILFDDDSPPNLKPLPWPGAKIHLSLRYAGMVLPDSNGYFKVTLTGKQFEDLKARKSGKNIFVPSYESRNSSTALHTFPVESLTANIDQVTAVKIPRPMPPKAE